MCPSPLLACPGDPSPYRPVEPLAGAAQTEDGVEVAFDGWMELIGAIAELLNTNGRKE
jgi:hypothetical protein